MQDLIRSKLVTIFPTHVGDGTDVGDTLHLSGARYNETSFYHSMNSVQRGASEDVIIDHQRTDLLVRPQHLKGHLSLLHALHTLRRTIEAGDASRFLQDVHIMNPDTRWKWFVNIQSKGSTAGVSALVNSGMGTLNKRFLRSVS
ncbi:hypothetical protein BDN67DRAFT_170162 [Paxillus ammoniavirescens]|nr:hypothetical protein BDN67DRAFT_170162 [Paxillus ammoniavirescens]